MPSSFLAYIDESGDEGFTFGRPVGFNSSEWITLSAVITRRSDDLSATKLIDQARVLFKKPRKAPIHFRDLKHEQRVPLVDLISKARLTISTVLVYKLGLTDRESFKQFPRLYFYFTRYLLERVSWYCRDEYQRQRDSGDGTAEIIFSNRAGMSYEDLRIYFEWLSNDQNVKIDWNVIKPSTQMREFSPMKRMGLIIADAVASSFYYAVQADHYGFTEDRYARMLKPRIYKRGNYASYGLKFFPKQYPAQPWLADYK